MISALLFDRKEEELNLIDEAFRDVIAIHTDDSCKVLACKNGEELSRAVSATEIIDYNFLEAIDDDGIEIAGKIRKRYPDSAILLVVSDSMKPTQYIKPSIMASALILRPSTDEDMKETIKEFVLSMKSDDDKNENTSFFADTGEGKTRIPYDKILYVEAREKKIFIRLKREEYGIKDTLETMAEKLPENFIKCHRSFIINKDKIVSYNKQTFEVSLEGGVVIPVSRPFRPMMKDL